MIKKRNIFITLLFMLTLLFSVSGISTWVLTNSTNEFKQQSDVMRTVSVYYQTNEIVSTYVAYETLPAPIDIGGDRYTSSKDADAKTRYDKGQNIQYNKSEIFSDSTGKYYTYDINEEEPIREGSGKWYNPYKYTVIWETYKQYTHYLTEQSNKNDITTQTPKTISVKNNSYLYPTDILTDYENAGFYTDSTFSKFFDFTKPITANTNIYIKYIKSDESITNKINNVLGTVSLFDSNRNSEGIGLDVKTETGAYDSSSKTAFLDTTTIISGSTLNLTYGTGEINLSPYEGAVEYANISSHRNSNDDWVSVNVTDASSTPNKCALKVKLSGDLTVKGNLYIGAKIGSNGSGSKYSYIIGEYTELDLNGHNLIIENGGVVTAFGLISDTLGTGKIIVKDGGNLISTFTIFDGRGGNQSTFGYSKGQSPFTQYCSPYITAKMRFNYGSSFTAYLKVDLGNLGISNTRFNVLSNNNNAIFGWNSGNTSEYVLINPYIVTDLYSTNAYTDNITKDDLYKRFEIDTNANINMSDVGFKGNVNISYDLPIIGLVELKEEFTIYLGRTDFPVSPMFDIIIRSGYTININFGIRFYPGSSLLAEKGSTIHFDYLGQKTYEAVKVSKMGISKTMPSEEKYLAGSILAHNYNLSYFNGYTPYSFSVGVYTEKSSSLYFSKINISNITIEGNITFDKSIDTTYDLYKISGPINISEEGMKSIKNNKNYLNTYGLKGEQYGTVWFTKDNILGDNTNKQSYVLVTSYESSPLISYGKAYIYNSSLSIEGTHDKVTGVITSGNENYILKPTNNHLLNGGSGANYQDYPQDRNLTPTKIVSVSTNGIVNDGTSYYVFFSGIFVPVTSIVSDTEVVATLSRFNSNIDSNIYTSTKLNVYSNSLTYTESSGLWDVVIASA